MNVMNYVLVLDYKTVTVTKLLMLSACLFLVQNLMFWFYVFKNDFSKYIFVLQVYYNTFLLLLQAVCIYYVFQYATYPAL